MYQFYFVFVSVSRRFGNGEALSIQLRRRSLLQDAGGASSLPGIREPSEIGTGNRRGALVNLKRLHGRMIL